MQIQALSADVIDQIAAGEVVERPSHLLKELIENALDAQATEIDVEVQNGGRSCVVTDNGSGIVRDELHLALSRHATSKIDKGDDLWSLTTFGFRGEALAAIGSVCDLSLESKPKHQTEGYGIRSCFGEVREEELSSVRVGTRVSIRDLFTNVPARLKFLKSDVAEMTQIKNTLKALALAHPKVSFRLRLGQQDPLHWTPCENLQQRAEQVLDLKGLHWVHQEVGEYNLEFAFSSPDQVLRQNRQIWLLVQNRWVQDRTLMAAILDAYRNLLMHGEYPQVVLKLRVPPAEVDVNIHPAKSAVRFLDSGRVFRAVAETLRQALGAAPWVKKTSMAGSIGGYSHRPVESQSVFAASGGVRGTELDSGMSAETSAGTEPISGIEGSRTVAFLSQSQSSYFLYPKKQGYSRAELQNASPSLPVIGELRPEELGTEPLFLEVQSHPQRNLTSVKKATFWSGLDVLAQSNMTYILAQSNESLFLIDQHAAHERVLFETILQQFEGGGMEAQSYLVPLILDLDDAGVEAVLSQSKELQKLGVHLEQMGPATIAINSGPVLLKDGALLTAIGQLSRDILEKGGSFAFSKAIAEVAASLACHSAIRAGQALSVEEMKSLLMQMDEFSFSSFCPHGRPVSIELSFNKLERDFGRIV